jgi:hypothetical protein
MPNPLSLELLAIELLRRGLPRPYVQRVVRELAEHCADILDEQPTPGSASDRLGAPAALADSIVSAYRARTFCGRHPILTFVVAPIPLVILAWIGVVLIFTLLDWVGEWLGVAAWTEGKPLAEWPVFAVWCVLSFYYVLMFAPFALVSAVLCRLARRAGRSSKWVLVGCLLVGLLAASVSYGCKLPDAPGTGSITIAWLLYPAPGQPLLHRLSFTQQLLQFAVPLGIGLYAVWKSSRRGPTTCEVSA